MEERENIFFSETLKIGCFLYKNIFFQKKGEQNNKLCLDIRLVIFIYLNLVVFPQGVRGYLIAFVRPPWG